MPGGAVLGLLPGSYCREHVPQPVGGAWFLRRRHNGVGGHLLLSQRRSQYVPAGQLMITWIFQSY
jgi:hypothetical protein